MAFFLVRFRARVPFLIHGALLFAAILSLEHTVPAFGQDARQEIRTLLEQRDRDLKQAIKPLLENPKTATATQKQRVKDLINSLINFDEMSRQALGPYWKNLTSAQRRDFVNVFGDIVRSQSLSDLDAYNSRVTYDQIVVVGDSAYVRTTTTYQGKPAKIEYYLGRTGGAWYAHNIYIDEVGTVEGYARSFRAVIRKKGFDALMQSLYKKRESVQATS